MRKIALLLTICIMLSLAACGRSEADMPLQENDMDEYTQINGSFRSKQAEMLDFGLDIFAKERKH